MTIESFKAGAHHALISPVLWPLTSCYLAGITAMSLVVADMIEVISSFILFGIATVLIALVSLLREVRIVHILVNSQHDALVRRIGQLVGELIEAGVAVPKDPNTEKTGSVV